MAECALPALPRFWGGHQSFILSYPLVTAALYCLVWAADTVLDRGLIAGDLKPEKAIGWDGYICNQPLKSHLAIAYIFKISASFFVYLLTRSIIECYNFYKWLTN